MKKALLFVIILILFISGCGLNQYDQKANQDIDTNIPRNNFSDEGFFSDIVFQGHSFGESLKEVIELEQAEPDSIIKYDKGKSGSTITFEDKLVFGFSTDLSFTFSEDMVYIIDATANNIDDNASIEQRYEELKRKLIDLYGEPSEEVVYEEDDSYQLVAMWFEIKYSIVLSSKEDGFVIVLRHV